MRDDSLIRRAAKGDAPFGFGFDLPPLPDDIVALLCRLDAPPRLAAHLRAVFDVAVQLVDSVAREFPGFRFDAAAVVFGAATHDIGKARHSSELDQPGSDHEAAGYELLVENGVPERLARFTRSHGAWDTSDATAEDELVALADKLWRGRRDEVLEHRVVTRISVAEEQEPWRVYARLDKVLTRISADSANRLDFQSWVAAW